MKFKLLLFKFLLVAGVMTATAQSDTYLHIRTADGWEVLNLDTVDRLTFKDGTMTATDAKQNTVATFKQDTLAEMYFSEDAAVEEITTPDSKATFRFDTANGTVTILSDGAFGIYNAAGLRLAEIPDAKAGEKVSLKGFPAGVIVLKSGNYSLKVMVK